MKRLLLLTLLFSSESQALTQLPCGSDASRGYSWPNGTVWPFAYMSNMPADSAWRALVDDAAFKWNHVPGAALDLRRYEETIDRCGAPDQSGFGVVGWDDGTCGDWANVQVGEHSGISFFYEQSCVVTAAFIYFNTNTYSGRASPGADFFHGTALHELGHYVRAAHTWDEVSAMGYGFTNQPIASPAARDQAFARAMHPSGEAAPAHIELSRFAVLSDIGEEVVPNEKSYGEVPAPTCGSRCATFSDVTVTFTIENQGAVAATDKVAAHLKLDGDVVNTWSWDGFPAETFSTVALTTKIPDTVTTGNHQVSVELDDGTALALGDLHVTCTEKSCGSRCACSTVTTSPTLSMLLFILLAVARRARSRP